MTDLDLETRLRDSLHAHVGDTAVRHMPPGTPTHVRRRQATAGLAGLAVVALAVAGTVGLWSVVPHGGVGEGPADGTLLQPPSHPIEAVPEGWPRVDVVAPEEAPYVMPRDVADATGPVTVVAAGTANGALFSYMAWFGGSEGDVAVSDGPCIGFAGPWAGGAPPTEPSLQGFGGPISSTCAFWHDLAVPRLADLYAAGQQDPETAPGFAANYGFLSERVARLELVLDDGSTVEIPILEGPAAWEGLRTFLYFPPVGRTGTLTVFDADGTALARADICEAVVDGPAGGCGWPVEQLVPVAG
jgi:hypothetical protein